MQTGYTAFMLASWTAWRTRFRRIAAEAEMTLALPEDPIACVTQIAEQLAVLRATPGLGAGELAERLVPLEIAARRCYRDATRRYLAHLNRESPETLAAWAREVESCLVPLAHVHQSLVVPWTKQRKGRPLPTEQVAEVLARGVRAGAAVLKWSYLRGAAEPVGVWADLCRLYAIAEGRACARTPVTLAPGSDLRSSVEREFLQACMLAVAQPARLRPEQVDIAERVAHFCTPGFGLSSAGDPRFTYVVDIEGGDGPCPREPGMAAGPAWRSFGMDGGERLLAALQRLVHTDRIPPRGFGAEVDKALVVDTLEHLRRCWQIPAPPEPAPSEAEAADPAGEPLAES